jgi:HK97 family phage major capsid protein
MTKIKTGDLNRIFDLDRSAIDADSRTVRLSFSSEEPVERWFGQEVLDHQPGSVRLDRMNGGAPLLLDHDLTDQIGRVENATIENGRGSAVVRFSKSSRAEEIWQDVIDGIRTNISVGYRIHEMNVEGEKDSEIYRATDWQPHEVSIVSVPADTSVGIGRDLVGDHETQIHTQGTVMTEQTIDIDAVKLEARTAALTEEKTRVGTINAMAKDAGYLRELADKAIEDGMPIDDFNKVALDRTKDEMKRQPTVMPDAPVRSVDMSRTEREQYSLMRAIQAQASGDWSGAGLEREVSETIAQRHGPSNGGFYLPIDMAWSRDLAASNSGNIVGTDHMGSSFIDALRANMVTSQLGARVMTNLQGNVAIPALNAKTNVYWVAEGAAPTEGAPTFRQVTLSPKNIAAYVDITRNLMIQSDPSVENIIRQDITNGVANALDTVALNGGGANEPSGVLQATGIGSVTLASAAAPTFGEIVDIETQISQDNALTGSLAYVTTPSMAGALKQTAKDAGSGRFVIESNEMNGYRVATTTNCPASTIIFGNWSDLIIGQFGAIEVLTERSASTGILTLGIHLAVDVGVRHAESFAKGA